MRENQNGFSITEGVLILVVVCLISSIGWYVWRVRHSNNVSKNSASVETTQKTTVKGSSSAQPIESKQINIQPKVAIPNTCDGFNLDTSGTASTSYEAVKAGMVGQWIGCVTTPTQWKHVPYLVSIDFKSDGTYSAKQISNIMGASDGGKLPAFYYGTDEDNPAKVYTIDDYQDNGFSVGTISIYFDVGSTNVGGLRNIKLTGNTLSFDFWHRNSYGPIQYRLVRVNQG